MNPQSLIPDPDIFHHSTPVQIRFNDVDVLGHMNNVVYLSLYDTAKADYFTAVRKKQIDWKNVDIVVANINCSYIAPVFFGEKIEVLTACLYISEKSFRLIQMIRESDTLQPKSVCESIMVSFDPVTQTSCEMPDEWKRMLCDFEKRDLLKK